MGVSVSVSEVWVEGEGRGLNKIMKIVRTVLLTMQSIYN